MSTQHRRQQIVRHKQALAKRKNPLEPEHKSFIKEHPWMTFFIVMAGLSTVATVLGPRS